MKLIRVVAGHFECYRAAVEYSPPELGDTPAERIRSRYVDLAFIDMEKSLQVDESMLVLVPEILEGEQRFEHRRRSPLGVGLQLLDECDLARPDTAEYVGSPTLPIGEPDTFGWVSAGENGKPGATQFSTFPINGEPIFQSTVSQ